MPLVFFHGAGGLLADNPFLDQLAARYHVFAPELPGYGDSTGEELLEDMLDFTLHGWDVVSALGLTKPHLVGHSMGGMIAAEMAAIAPGDLDRLVLVGAAGLWIEEHPIPDIFASFPGSSASPFPGRGQGRHCQRRVDSRTWASRSSTGQQRRLARAGKILFPIPNAACQAPLRVTAPPAVLWGGADKLIIPAYASGGPANPGAQVQSSDAGHMLPTSSRRTS